MTPRQLPGDVRGFVNRQAELAHLSTLVAKDVGEPFVVAVAIIAGTAGVGKTALALHWAHSVRDHFPDGELYVNLRGYDPGPPATPEQVLDRFLRDLGVPATSIPAELEDRAALFRSLLASRRMLLLLDNAATVGQVRPLLPGTASCLVLITSRSRLSGLVAREGAYRLGLDVLTENDAVSLIRSVTTRYRADDQPDDLVEVVRLCARLPLALRIAAERAASRPLMMLNELIADLRDESVLWDALTAESEEEADAVRTVFAWSYRALPDPAARLFRLLSVHPGPDFSLEAAAALAGMPAAHVRRLLDVLVGAYLIEQSAPGRYQIHDLLRAYAAEQARQFAADGDEALIRLVSWYLHTADRAQHALAPYDAYRLPDDAPPGITPLSFAQPETALRWYETERTNIVSVVRAAAAAELHGLTWRLAAALRVIHAQWNAFDEWETIGTLGAASAATDGDLPGQAMLLEGLGKLYVQTRRLDQAETGHLGALEIRRRLGDRFGEGLSLNALGLLALRRRRLTEALARFEESTLVFSALGDDTNAPLRWTALTRANAAEAQIELGRPAAAAEILSGTLPVFRDLNDRFSEGNALFLLSRTQRAFGDIEAARHSIDAAMAIATAADNLAWQGYWLLELARVQRAAGHPAEALTSYQRSAAIQRQLADRSREALALDGTGETYFELARPAEAVNFHRLAITTHRDLGDHWHHALALTNLARALTQTNHPQEAQTTWHQALTALAPFDDPTAIALRQSALRQINPD
ncbi:ATP-binding protein [Acrocarpospora catenulata]|uniref:ATP-binding protein n=1 Tax=Acrocarpospora catenulata TaxID=2836182 RepID=UPI001BDA1C6C|nr:tetratricopeptide repeat protein [Acrocarpospora catenulata]